MKTAPSTLKAAKPSTLFLICFVSSSPSRFFLPVRAFTSVMRMITRLAEKKPELTNQIYFSPVQLVDRTFVWIQL